MHLSTFNWLVTYQTLCQPVLEYADEAWGHTKQHCSNSVYSFRIIHFGLWCAQSKCLLPSLKKTRSRPSDKSEAIILFFFYAVTAMTFRAVVATKL